MRIGELCSRDVVVVRAEESVQTAAELMRQYHVGDVVVVREEGGKLYPVGVLTDRDVVVEVVALRVAPESVTAGDTMTPEPVIMEADADLLDATARMRHYGVRRLIVVDEDESLLGILAQDDVLDLLAEELNNLAALVHREQEVEVERRVL